LPQAIFKLALRGEFKVRAHFAPEVPSVSIYRIISAAYASHSRSSHILSFSTPQVSEGFSQRGVVREKNEWFFVWPIWLPRLSRVAIEALLAHPDLLQGEGARLQLLGVAEIFRARRQRQIHECGTGAACGEVRIAPVKRGSVQ
jgi:hypothetical protein